MKTRGSICSPVIICLLAMAVFGCARKGEVTPEDARPGERTEVDSRGFDPLELPEDREVVSVTHPKSGAITGELAFVTTDPSQSDTTVETVTDLPDQIDSLHNQAFRIQLFTGKVYGEAKEALTVAEEIFDRPVFLDYEVPYFKIRVGNFADREDAEEYLMRAKTAGYTNAWIVAVNVRVQEAAPLYDETDLPLLYDSLMAPDEEVESYDESDN